MLANPESNAKGAAWRSQHRSVPWERFWRHVQNVPLWPPKVRTRCLIAGRSHMAEDPGAVILHTEICGSVSCPRKPWELD